MMFDVDGKQDHDQGALHMNGSLQNGLDEKGFRYRFLLPFNTSAGLFWK